MDRRAATSRGPQAIAGARSSPVQHHVIAIQIPGRVILVVLEAPRKKSNATEREGAGANEMRHTFYENLANNYLEAISNLNHALTAVFTAAGMADNREAKQLTEVKAKIKAGPKSRVVYRKLASDKVSYVFFGLISGAQVPLKFLEGDVEFNLSPFEPCYRRDDARDQRTANRPVGGSRDCDPVDGSELSFIRSSRNSCL